MIGPLAPLRLDDVVFAPDWWSRETGWRAGALIGELEPTDGSPTWRARRFADGVFRDWQDLRSRAEARAFVAARVRMPCWRRGAAQ